MNGRPRRSSAAGRLCLLALVLLAAGCARHVRMPALELGDVRSRYEQALAGRVNASACALADLDVRVEGTSLSPIGPPAGRLLCALLGLWRPDSAAWATVASDSGLAHVRWQEAGDSLWLSIDGAGRPVALAWRAPDGPRMHVRYETWSEVAGTELPSRVYVQDERGAVRARLDLSGFEPRRTADPEWFALELPERTERVDWPELGRLLRRAGEDW